MPWFRNHYVCTVCEGHWLAEAAAVLDVDCPHCRTYDVVPYRSDDLTRIKVRTPAAKVRVKLKAKAA